MVKHLSFEEAFEKGEVPAITKGYRRKDLKEFLPSFIELLKQVPNMYFSTREMERMVREQYPNTPALKKHVRLVRGLIARGFILCGWTLHSGSTRYGKKFKRGQLSKEQSKLLEEWLGAED